ncbi:MAG: hypothetical protein JXR97_13715 [Planctomycetes bacterium]|nr:hypothetical protein [Planctomycetota bacterium]
MFLDRRFFKEREDAKQNRIRFRSFFTAGRTSRKVNKNTTLHSDCLMRKQLREEAEAENGTAAKVDKYAAYSLVTALSLYFVVIFGCEYLAHGVIRSLNPFLIIFLTVYFLGGIAVIQACKAGRRLLGLSIYLLPMFITFIERYLE